MLVVLLASVACNRPETDLTMPVDLPVALVTTIGDDDLPNIAVIDLADGEIRSVTTDDASWQADLSPDGKRVAFTRGSGTYRDCCGYSKTSIWVSKDGTARGVSSGSADSSPVWSPDGEWIAYSRQTNRTLNGEVRVMRHDGSDDRSLTADLEGVNLAPAWSPDGQQIAFRHEPPRAPASGVAEETEIWVMPVRGTKPPIAVATMAGHANLGRPAWSPDGTHLAFESLDKVETVNLVTGERRVWRDSASGAAWLSHRELVFIDFDTGDPATLSPPRLLAIDVTDSSERVLSNLGEIHIGLFDFGPISVRG